MRTLATPQPVLVAGNLNIPAQQGVGAVVQARRADEVGRNFDDGHGVIKKV